jgi:hypothetical protein
MRKPQLERIVAATAAIAIALTLAAGCAVVFTPSVQDTETSPPPTTADSTPPSVSPDPSTVSVVNLRISYDMRWAIDEEVRNEDGEMVRLKDQGSRVFLTFTCETGKIWLGNQYDPVSYLRDSIEEQAARWYDDTITVLRDTGGDEGDTYAGLEWGVYEVETHPQQDTTSRQLLLIHNDGYDRYVISVTAIEASEYDRAWPYAREVLTALTFDDSKQKADEEAGMKLAIGEWDCGVQGYFVFMADGTMYFFMDSSKGMDNVIIGDYTADNKVPTNAAGYVEGLNITAKITYVCMGGVETELRGNETGQYIFTPAAAGGNEYEFANMTTGARGAKAVKVTDTPSLEGGVQPSDPPTSPGAPGDINPVAATVENPANVGEWIESIRTAYAADGTSPKTTFYYRITGINRDEPAVIAAIEQYNESRSFFKIGLDSIADYPELGWCMLTYEVYFPADYPQPSYGISSPDIRLGIDGMDGGVLRYNGRSYIGLSVTDISESPDSREVQPGDLWQGGVAVFVMVKDFDEYLITYDGYDEDYNSNYSYTRGR